MTGSQTIFRNASPSNPYAQILNACLQDDDLGDGPGWVLMLCLSLPRDWRVSLEWVARKRDLNVTTVRKHIRHLERLGYCRRARVRNPDGTLGAYEFAFTDQRGHFGVEAAPAMQKPSMVKPAMEKSPPTKKETNQNTKHKHKGNIQLKAERLANVCSEDLVGQMQQDQVDAQDSDWVDALDDAGEAKLVAEAAAHAAQARAQDAEAKRLSELAAATEALCIERTPEAALLASIPEKQIAKLRAWGLDPAALASELAGEIRKRKVANPGGYLVGMARKRVAARDGIPEAMVEATYSRNPTIRATAYAVALGSTQPERWKGARRRGAPPGGMQSAGSHLMAALERGRLGA